MKESTFWLEFRLYLHVMATTFYCLAYITQLEEITTHISRTYSVNTFYHHGIVSCFTLCVSHIFTLIERKRLINEYQIQKLGVN